jgi:hypothetical protein
MIPTPFGLSAPWPRGGTVTDPYICVLTQRDECAVCGGWLHTARRADPDLALRAAAEHRRTELASGLGYCRHCRGNWPCPTARLAAALRDTLAERDALLAMVECCRDLVPTLYGKVQEDLAAIVGWPETRPR